MLFSADLSAVIHLIYNSAAVVDFTREDLVELLSKARDNNASKDVTGMLLYVDGSFFQVLEGPEESVDALAERIAQDPRHDQMTVIIREPISKRSFSEWTMGFADVASDDLQSVEGFNDFFDGQTALTSMDAGRAKKLLCAFEKGRWRVRLGARAPRFTPAVESPERESFADPRPEFGIAFQPVVDATRREVLGYEAQVCGLDSAPPAQILQQIPLGEVSAFETDVRRMAIGKASRLELTSDLYLSFTPHGSWDAIRGYLQSTVDTAARCEMDISRIVIEMKHESTLTDPAALADCLKDVRRQGVRVSISDFGSSHAGLALLEHYQPEMISLSMCLVHGIDGHGPRQAIVRGLVQTCDDLGIDIVAKGVETTGEFAWLLDEGIDRVQGELIAAPGLEVLPRPMLPVG